MFAKKNTDGVSGRKHAGIEKHVRAGFLQCRGAGLTTEALALRATGTSTAGPFRSRARSPGVWLEARLVAEVSYAELMQGRLRAPVFRGFVTRRAVTADHG